MKVVFVICVSAFICSCTTTGQVADGLNSQYVGKKSDEFFVAHGAPYNRFNLDSGDFMYEWSSGKRGVPMPETSTTSGQVTNSGAFYATTQSTGGGSIEVECQVRILAGSDHMIQEIKIVRDTIGMWKLSRCNEVFGD